MIVVSEALTCERCDEKIEPVNLSTLPIIGRFTGTIAVIQRTVHLRSIRQRWSVLGAYDGPTFSRTDVTLCDQCWGAFLSWVCDPGQERAKIAAENRRKNERLKEVAEARRERQVQKYLGEGKDRE